MIIPTHDNYFGPSRVRGDRLWIWQLMPPWSVIRYSRGSR
jgi:hypothetical protein